MHPTEAPLLPKLRGHVAEFLNESYSARLSMLCSPTCVGLRYGHLRLARSFSWQLEIMTFGTISFPPHHSPALRFADLPTNQPHCLDGHIHRSASLPFCVTPLLITAYGGTGISTCCPSTTPFGLALGPDLP
ncbi:hypothetical protein BN871_AB_00790 [Paenibacillus sp. P22]|nr:hypothetical protein BN871_AB_00790 [Paenibacillus sp. P22]